MRAVPWLVMPTIPAAAWERSIIRPLTYGPRSLMSTSTERPFSQVGDTNARTKRQGLVRGGHGVRVEPTARGETLRLRIVGCNTQAVPPLGRRHTMWVADRAARTGMRM